MGGVIKLEHITGLVLAGGRGNRMGGVDKGLQLFNGAPLALHAVQRLAPQVGDVMVSANRNLPLYATMGVPVWPDSSEGMGPLAGMLTGLTHCTTPYLATVPCDVPHFPHDLVQRLVTGLQNQKTNIAMAVTPNDMGQNMELKTQPIFCLMKINVIEDLRHFLNTGQRKVEIWVNMQNHVHVVFERTEEFANANTFDELHQLES
jgi:molybdenum cofactor guanylyltransferase